jgi:hypothetical protein
VLLEEQLEFEFSFGCPSIEAEYYRDGAQDLIARLIPADLLDANGLDLPRARARFADLLPVISWSNLDRGPCTLSVLLLCRYRLNACNFFYDMVSRWLLPQKQINVELFFASDVRLPHLSDDLLSVAEIVVYLKSAQDVEAARRNMHAVETEIRLGVVSNYHARRILEFKGLSADGKTAMIQEKISSLIQSHSKDFDRGIFSQMQQFLVTCPEAFKKKRDYHHISRIISNLYSIRKLLDQNVQVLPSKRHVQLKYLRTRLHVAENREKPVLGVLIALNLLGEHERFEPEHFMSAIQKKLPTALLVQGSAFVDPSRDPKMQAMYLEVEREGGGDFSLDEVQNLKTALPEQIRSHIEQLSHPIFMPRNEEEVLRNIMVLSRQLRFASDPPHVILTFDEQKGQKLHFTVILVRVLAEDAPTAEQLFAESRGRFKFAAERIRRVGRLRKKYVKEAAVFRTSTPIEPFLRLDHSVDMVQARAAIVADVAKAMGDVRDYNGGMIYKQSETLSALKSALGKIAVENSSLVERFFYSLAPMEMRSVFEVDALKQLFLGVLQAIKEGRRFVKCDTGRAVAALPVKDGLEKRKIAERVEHLGLPPYLLASCLLETEEAHFVGYLCLSAEKQEQFSSLF